MDELLEQLVADPWGRLLFHYLLTSGLWNVYLFLLVASRFAGALLIAPMFTAVPVPFPIRLALVVLLSLIVTPTLTPAKNDTNAVRLIAEHSTRSSSENTLPATVADLIGGIASEVGLGAFLGIGVIGVFSGLQLGGEWLERHTGLGMGAVLNPEWASGTTACGSFAQLLGVAALLLAQPIGGHWSLLQSLVQSFHAVPVGTVSWSMSWCELLNGVAQQCLILGVRVAMPLVAAMMLVDITLAFASRGTTPAENSSYLAIRMGVALLVLSLTMTNIPESITVAMISAVQFVENIRLN